uniref:Neurochondrin n=1 Tax=Anopheles dirus TaxID=7168 RepID=A0A182NCT0_9DIPT
MSGEVSEPIKKCSLILKNAKSDTEKFAALFMVTKLIKGKDCNQAGKRMLFESIGFEFLRKLLTSKDVPDDCPASVYQSVALSILSCFCEDEQLATHQDMLDSIPVFLGIVSTCDDDEYDDNLIVINEAYHCLQSISLHESGRLALRRHDVITKMAQIYTQRSFQIDEALTLIVTLVARFGANSWESDPKLFHALLQRVSLDFETDHAERKFELAEMISALLFHCRRDLVARTVQGEIWPECLYKGISDILMSKIGKAQRDPALKLAANAVDVLGIEWTLHDAENPKKFFLLLLQLAAIEVRMQMDNKSFNQCVQQADLITACFIILELSINFMSTDQLDLDQKDKQQVYTGLKGAFSAVLGVLVKLANDTKKDRLQKTEKAFAYAMVRVLTAWLAQETSAMKNQVAKVLPFLFKLANESFYESRDYRIAHKADNVDDHEQQPPADILRVMLPAICHLVVEEEARQIFLKEKEEQVLYDCLLFHWSIAHYKKPPVPRAERLKRMNEPDPELTPQQLDDMKDSRTAIVSLCNILMNITVLEAKLVEESALFAQLLRFIFENLPELKDIPDNLVMHGHLAVLGLLLLKQQASKIKKNDFSICRYIQTTIRFLWDAYNIDESNDPQALVVSLQYKEHWFEIMELWFLGMQTMSGIIKLIPWISEFAIESGWAEGIVETLRKVKIGTLPPNVKLAYEDFLSQLVDANPAVAPVLKKADALKVCRNHRMMDLGKKLGASILREVADLLHREHGLSRELANEAATNYLTAFRRCPDNPDVALVAWRSQLWQDVLPGTHKHLAADLYGRWLEWRYRYLALPADLQTMLQTLRLQYLLGIITNGPTAAQWEKIDRLALNKYFDCILVSSDLPWAKPDRNIFYAACHYLGVPPGQCVMIGDKLETDIQGGIEASLGATVWLPLPTEQRIVGDRTMQDVPEHVRPDAIVDSVLKLPTLLPPSTSFRARTSPAQQPNAGDSWEQKTTRNRAAQYNRILPDIPDLYSSYSSSSNDCSQHSNGSTSSNGSS